MEKSVDSHEVKSITCLRRFFTMTISSKSMSRKRLSWRHLLRVTTTPWVVITSVGIDLPRNWRLPVREALKNPARDFHLVSPGRRTIIGGRRWYCWWNGVGRGRQWSRGSAIVEVKFWNLNGVKDIGSSDHGKKAPEVLCPEAVLNRGRETSRSFVLPLLHITARRTVSEEKVHKWIGSEKRETKQLLCSNRGDSFT